MCGGGEGFRGEAGRNDCKIEMMTTWEALLGIAFNTLLNRGDSTPYSSDV